MLTRLRQAALDHNKVLDAHISKCFDRIPHDELMKLVAEQKYDKIKVVTGITDM